MLDVRYSHYFYQSLNRLQRGLSAIAELLVIIFGQSFSKPPMPNHKWLFSESPTFGGTQHYLQLDVKVLHFTR